MDKIKYDRELITKFLINLHRISNKPLYLKLKEESIQGEKPMNEQKKLIDEVAEKYIINHV